MRPLKPSTRDKMIKRLLSLVSVTHEALEEDTAPEDSFGYATEQENLDACADVRARLRVTPWAWCVVLTTVSLGGFSAGTYLGGCSYLSAEDFERSAGAQQAYDACSALLDILIQSAERGAKASTLLSDLKRR